MLRCLIHASASSSTSAAHLTRLRPSGVLECAYCADPCRSIRCCCGGGGCTVSVLWFELPARPTAEMQCLPFVESNAVHAASELHAGPHSRMCKLGISMSSLSLSSLQALGPMLAELLALVLALKQERLAALLHLEVHPLTHYNPSQHLLSLRRYTAAKQTNLPQAHRRFSNKSRFATRQSGPRKNGGMGMRSGRRIRAFGARPSGMGLIINVDCSDEAISRRRKGDVPNFNLHVFRPRRAISTHETASKMHRRRAKAIADHQQNHRG